VVAWELEGAQAINKVLTLTDEEREKVIERGLANAKRFETKLALDKIEIIYKSIIASGK
jgi:hypothetical protein